MAEERVPQPGLASPRFSKQARIYKSKNRNAVKAQGPYSILMVNFAGHSFHPPFADVTLTNVLASLEQYREDIFQQVTKDVGSTAAELTADLDGISIDVNTHLKHLTSIGDGLQRPFNAETLVVHVRRGVDGSEAREEVLLQARMAAFCHTRQEKQKILTDLWDEWEAIQMDIITLAAEVCGSSAMNLNQEQRNNMTEGQQQQFDTALVDGDRHHKQTIDDLNGLHQDLLDLEESLGQITIKTKRAVVEMQQVSDLLWLEECATLTMSTLQQYNVQRSKLFKGLHRHMELLASL